MSIFIQGFAIGMGLIVAIGAQNAFVLKQGLKKQGVFWICLVCALSDAILILLGVLGFAKVIEKIPEILRLAQYFGAAFLFFYGAQHFYAALMQNQALLASEVQAQSLWKLLVISLTLTWLNPHVYLDTVILLGSISTQYAENQVSFTLGAITASFVFFFSLGFGARLLQPIFQRPSAWKILDVLIGIVMWIIAFNLIVN